MTTSNEGDWGWDGLTAVDAEAAGDADSTRPEVEEDEERWFDDHGSGEAVIESTESAGPEDEADAPNWT